MSKISRNVIFSESKKQRKTTRGGGIGVKGPYSYPLLIALLIAPDGCSFRIISKSLAHPVAMLPNPAKCHIRQNSNKNYNCNNNMGLGH